MRLNFLTRVNVEIFLIIHDPRHWRNPRLGFQHYVSDRMLGRMGHGQVNCGGS